MFLVGITYNFIIAFKLYHLARYGVFLYETYAQYSDIF